MIGRIFLGPAWHWGLLVVVSVLFWYCGRNRLHVIEFNLFVLAMLFGTAIAVFAVVVLSRPGDRLTRDVLVADDDTDSEHKPLDRE